MVALKSVIQNNVLIVTLCRGDRGNSIDADFFREYMDVLAEADSHDDVRAIVTCAEGPNFCVGADAGNLDSYTNRSIDQIFAEDFSGKIGIRSDDENELGTGIFARAVFKFQKPLIAVVQGVAAGGGMSFALLHHFRFCGEKSRFTTAFAKLGIGPELGMTFTLPLIVGQSRALDLLLSARILNADEAQAIGLADQVVEEGKLKDSAIEFAEKIAKTPPLAVQSILRRRQDSMSDALTAKLKEEWTEQRELFASEDFKEGVQAFKDKRTPVFKGK